MARITGGSPRSRRNTIRTTCSTSTRTSGRPDRRTPTDSNPAGGAQAHYRGGREESLAQTPRRLPVHAQRVRLLSKRAGVPSPPFFSDADAAAHGGVPAEV